MKPMTTAELEALTDEEYQALDDDTALQDVVMPPSPEPKDYSPESQAEWAREMMELYGHDWLDENPLVSEIAAEYNYSRVYDAPQRRSGQPIIDLLEQGAHVEELPFLLGATYQDMESVLFRDAKPGALLTIQAACRTEEETRIKDLAERVGAGEHTVARVVYAIGVLPDSLFANPQRTAYTAQDMRDMVVLYRNGSYTVAELAEAFDVKYHTVRKLMEREVAGD